MTLKSYAEQQHNIKYSVCGFPFKSYTIITEEIHFKTLTYILMYTPIQGT